LPVIITDLHQTLKSWFEYFKHSHYPTFADLDRWVRKRLRGILRKRRGGRGCGRGWDNVQWPPAFFARQGLYRFRMTKGSPWASARWRQELPPPPERKTFGGYISGIARLHPNSMPGFLQSLLRLIQIQQGRTQIYAIVGSISIAGQEVAIGSSSISPVKSDSLRSPLRATAPDSGLYAAPLPISRRALPLCKGEAFL
jgi:hypothetical protein